MPANRCWPFCSEHHALSSALLVPGACLSHSSLLTRVWSKTRESLTIARCPGTIASCNLCVLLVFVTLFCCRRCWRRDKPSLKQRFILALVGKFFANVRPRCLRLPVGWVSIGSVDFRGALGNSTARGDVCQVPPPMCGGGGVDLLCNMLRLPLVFGASPCFAGTFQRALFDFLHQQSVEHPVQHLVAHVRAVQVRFAGRIC